MELALAYQFTGLVGETNEIMKRADRINFTSDDGENLMRRTLRRWNDLDIKDTDPFTVMNTCKSLLNDTIRALEMDVRSKGNWSTGMNVIAGLNYLVGSGLNDFLGSLNEEMGDVYQGMAAVDAQLIQDIRLVLRKYWSYLFHNDSSHTVTRVILSQEKSLLGGAYHRYKSEMQ